MCIESFFICNFALIIVDFSVYETNAKEHTIMQSVDWLP